MTEHHHLPPSLSYYPPPSISGSKVLPPRIKLAMRHALRRTRPHGLTAEQVAQQVSADPPAVADQLASWCVMGEVDRSTDGNGEHVYHHVRRWPPRPSRHPGWTT
jgi:hypothetical protein